MQECYIYVTEIDKCEFFSPIYKRSTDVEVQMMLYNHI